MPAQRRRRGARLITSCATVTLTFVALLAFYQLEPATESNNNRNASNPKAPAPTASKSSTARRPPGPTKSAKTLLLPAFVITHGGRFDEARLAPDEEPGRGRASVVSAQAIDRLGPCPKVAARQSCKTRARHRAQAQSSTAIAGHGCSGGCPRRMTCLTRQAANFAKVALEEEPSSAIKWLVKRPGTDGGKGIELVQNARDVLDGTSVKRSMKDRLAQRYVSDLLLTPDGRKFDLRVYWVVASFRPELVLYGGGTCGSRRRTLLTKGRALT